MEKLWCGEAKMKYPMQWVVLVNLFTDKETHKPTGDVYLVTPDKKEAYAKAIALGDSMGNTIVIEGFNDTLQYVGGLTVCGQ
jgi:hypothetical protein